MCVRQRREKRETWAKHKRIILIFLGRQTRNEEVPHPKERKEGTHHYDDDESCKPSYDQSDGWVDEVHGHPHRDKVQASCLPHEGPFQPLQPQDRGVVGIVKPVCVAVENTKVMAMKKGQAIEFLREGGKGRGSYSSIMARAFS